MSNILTDIMGFFKRKKFVTRPEDNDVVVVGVHEPADVTGVASPIPIKDARLCTVADLRDPCERVNWPLLGSEAGVFLGKEVIEAEDPTQEPTCYYAFRRLKSLNLNLTIVENGDFVEFDTTAEENQAINIETADVESEMQVGLFKDKLGEALRFRSLYCSDSTISVTLSSDENGIDLTANVDGVNLGDGVRVFKEKNTPNLTFRTLTSNDNSITITEDINTIDFSCNNTGGSGITCEQMLSVLSTSTSFAQFKETFTAICQQPADPPA